MAAPWRKLRREDAVVLIAPLLAAGLILVWPGSAAKVWLIVALGGLLLNVVAYVDALADARLTKVLVATLADPERAAVLLQQREELRRDLARIAVQVAFVAVGALAVFTPGTLRFLLAPLLVYAQALVAAGAYADWVSRKLKLQLLEQTG